MIYMQDIRSIKVFVDPTFIPVLTILQLEQNNKRPKVKF